jgi:hypothetical protein
VDQTGNAVTFSSESAVEIGPKVQVRAEHGQGDSTSNGGRAINAINHAVAAADSGGGYSADGHNSVVGEDQVHLVSADNGEVDGQASKSLIIPADATLVDGLRALLVHHLKRSIGSSIVSLSTSQAELLEHHLARLASYAQKIVHTLAFATRFLSKQSTDAADGCTSNSQQYPDGGGQAWAAADANASSAADTQPADSAPRAPRKSLKLSDDEILNIYRSAQAEAAMEADWRGITGPARQVHSEGDFTSRSMGGTPLPRAAAQEARGGDREYLRILSRALQEPNRNPGLTAEIMDPSNGAVCCRPGVPTMLNAGPGDQLPLHGASNTSSGRRQFPAQAAGIHE